MIPDLSRHFLLGEMKGQCGSHMNDTTDAPTVAQGVGSSMQFDSGQGQDLANESCSKDLGMGQNSTTGGPQVLVLISLMSILVRVSFSGCHIWYNHTLVAFAAVKGPEFLS